MKPVTDPSLLAQLDAKPVTDPALLAQLEGPVKNVDDDSILRKVGLAGKAAFEGVTSGARAFQDAMSGNNVIKALGLPVAPDPVEHFLDQYTDKPKTSGERLMMDAISGGTGALTGGPGTVMNAVTGIAGGLGGGAAREAGGGPIAQIIAAIVAGGVPTALKSVGGTATRIIDNAVMPGGATRAAVRATTNVVDDPQALAAALANAKPGQTAGQAAVPTGSAEFAALQELARKNKPSAYAAVDDLQAAGQRRQLASIAGADSQELANAVRRQAKKSLNADVGAKMEAELGKANVGQAIPRLEREALSFADDAAQKAEDVRRLMNAKSIADESVLGGRVNPGGAPASGLGNPRPAAKYTYLDELGARADEAAGVAAGKSLEAGAGRRWTEAQIQHLESQGFHKLDTDALMAHIGRKLDDPKFGVSDINQKVLGKVGEKVKEWTDKNGGVIDAEALHEIRKTVVNETVQSLMAGAKPKASAAKAAGILTEIKPLIDDAIVAAGGTKWKDALKEYERKAHVIDQNKLGARALEMYDKNPKSLVALSEGNAPKEVEKVFGPGRDNLKEQMGAKANAIMDVAEALTTNAKQAELARAGQTKVGQLYNMESAPLTLPNLLSRPVMIANAIIKKLEGQGSQKTTDALSDLMRPENVSTYAKLVKRSGKDSAKKTIVDAVIAASKGGIAQGQNE